MVGGEESHELSGSVDRDGTGLVHIEVGPGLVEVGIEIVLEGSTGESLVGSEGLLSGGSSDGLGEVENTIWTTTFFLILSTFHGVLLEHGSDEDINLSVFCGVIKESRWDDSLVSGTLCWVEILKSEGLLIGSRGAGGLGELNKVDWVVVGGGGTNKGKDGKEFHC